MDSLLRAAVFCLLCHAAMAITTGVSQVYVWEKTTNPASCDQNLNFYGQVLSWSPYSQVNYYLAPLDDLDCKIRLEGETGKSLTIYWRDPFKFLGYDGTENTARIELLDSDGTTRLATYSGTTKPDNYTTAKSVLYLRFIAKVDPVRKAIDIQRILNEGGGDLTAAAQVSVSTDASGVTYTISDSGSASTESDISASSTIDTGTGGTNTDIDSSSVTDSSTSVFIPDVVVDRGPYINFTADITSFYVGNCTDNAAYHQCNNSRCIHFTIVCDMLDSDNCGDYSDQYFYPPSSCDPTPPPPVEPVPDLTPLYVTLGTILGLLALFWLCWKPGYIPWRLAWFRKTACANIKPCYRTCARGPNQNQPTDGYDSYDREYTRTSSKVSYSNDAYDDKANHYSDKGKYGSSSSAVRRDPFMPDPASAPAKWEIFSYND